MHDLTEEEKLKIDDKAHQEFLLWYKSTREMLEKDLKESEEAFKNALFFSKEQGFPRECIFPDFIERLEKLYNDYNED